MKIDISYRQFGSHNIIAITGVLDLYHIEELKKILYTEINKIKTSLIIDMEGISYSDSSGVSLLVSLHKKMKTKKGKFALLNVSKDTLNILKLAILDRFFTIYKSESDIPL